jgi:hypothetical protein
MNDPELREKVRQIVKQFATGDPQPVVGESLFNCGLIDSFSLADVVSVPVAQLHARSNRCSRKD